MSKIRIYELAKELGVDNKIVITKAMELGVVSKASHSSSLDAGEADQIRRALLRQAIGSPQQSEVVTRRVDRSTGQTEAVVERRSGNVIRRRRANEEDAPGEADGHANGGSSQPLHGGSPEGLFIEDSDLQKAVTEETVVRGSDGDQPVLEELTAEEEVVEVEEASAPEVGAPLEDDSKKVGPKVLGRIELPVRKTLTKSEGRPVAGAVGRPAVQTAYVEEEDEETKAKKKLAKKTRKREFGRGDLVDYEGRDFRKGKAGGGRTPAGRSDRGMQDPSQLDTRPKQKKVVKMGESITVGELSKQLSLKAGEVIAKLIELGILATINQAIDFDTATIIVEELGGEIESTSFDETTVLKQEEQEDPELLKERPPVVTVMGHVDHGKTSLLDYIRKASVAAKEHGGITQHIGAYSVEVNGKKITFIDTPGHAAFTSMRARGANVTDMVILVVAADDGVMPQTLEAINHAKAAGVPIVVAVNKMDKHEANPERIKQQLTERGLQPEDWGGDTMYFPVSALKGTGVQELLEGLLLLAEVKELRANPDRKAVGAIIETRQDRGRGVVATVLVQKGTLRVGDTFVMGNEYGRIRSMSDHHGEKLQEAGPSTPVEITGVNGVPSAGDDFLVVENEAVAREVAGNRAELKKARETASASGPISLEEFARRANNTAALELNVILKADVDGSMEAVRDAAEKLSNEKVKVKVIHAAVGGIIESDIQLAIASKAIVIGFGVRADTRAVAEAEKASVEIRFYRIIYELIDDLKTAMAGLLPPLKEEVHLGRAEVRETFTVPKAGTVAGSYVVDGIVRRNAFARLVRDSKVIFEGKMSSLRRFKDDVKEVQSNYECGIGLENYNDVKVGDVIEVYETKDVAQTLD